MENLGGRWMPRRRSKRHNDLGTGMADVLALDSSGWVRSLGHPKDKHYYKSLRPWHVSFFYLNLLICWDTVSLAIFPREASSSRSPCLSLQCVGRTARCHHTQQSLKLLYVVGTHDISSTGPPSRFQLWQELKPLLSLYSEKHADRRSRARDLEMKRCRSALSLRGAILFNDLGTLRSKY